MTFEPCFKLEANIIVKELSGRFRALWSTSPCGFHITMLSDTIYSISSIQNLIQKCVTVSQCHSVNTVHTLNGAWSSLILDLVYQISGSPQSWSELTLFLPATLLNFPCIPTTVDVLCVSVQLEGRKNPNFWGRGTSKRGDALWVCNILLSQQILRGKLNGFPPSAGRYTKSGWAFELPFVPLYLSVCSKGLKLRCFLCKMEN